MLTISSKSGSARSDSVRSPSLSLLLCVHPLDAIPQVVLADKYLPYEVTYEDCHVFNPGGFAGTDFTWSVCEWWSVLGERERERFRLMLLARWRRPYWRKGIGTEVR